jgi:hypothetical protein
LSLYIKGLDSKVIVTNLRLRPIFAQLTTLYRLPNQKFCISGCMCENCSHKPISSQCDSFSIRIIRMQKCLHKKKRVKWWNETSLLFVRQMIQCLPICNPLIAENIHTHTHTKHNQFCKWIRIIFIVFVIVV